MDLITRKRGPIIGREEAPSVSTPYKPSFISKVEISDAAAAAELMRADMRVGEEGGWRVGGWEPGSSCPEDLG